MVSKALRNLTFSVLGERRMTFVLALFYGIAQRLLHVAPLPVSYNNFNVDKSVTRWIETNRWTLQARGPIVCDSSDQPFTIRCQLKLPHMQTVSGSSSGIEAFVIDSEYPYFPVNFTRKVEITQRCDHKFLEIVKVDGQIAVLDVRHLPCILIHVARTIRKRMSDFEAGLTRQIYSDYEPMLFLRFNLADTPSQQLRFLWSALTVSSIKKWMAICAMKEPTTQDEATAYCKTCKDK